MSNLTTLPKGDSAWLLRRSIQRIMQQVSVLETNIGSSTTGNSANTQVIFNDNGTLRGDAGFTYNAATDTLSVGAATITGNLTVQTNALFVNSANNNVGLGTLTPSGASGRALEIYGGAGQSRLALKNDATGSASTDGSQIALVGSQLVIQNREASEITFETNNSERYRLDSTGVATWSNVGGVAGTAMTLNSIGLGVGVVPSGTNRFLIFNGATQALTLDTSGRLFVGSTSAFTDLTGSKEVRIGESGMQTLNIASLPASTATNIARGGVGGLVYVGGYNGTGQYGAVVLWTAASATVVSVINGTGSTITFGVSGGFLQITSSLVLTQVTASCIRI